jgi:hypothetical protein
MSRGSAGCLRASVDSCGRRRTRLLRRSNGYVRLSVSPDVHVRPGLRCRHSAYSRPLGQLPDWDHLPVATAHILPACDLAPRIHNGCVKHPCSKPADAGWWCTRSLDRPASTDRFRSVEATGTAPWSGRRSRSGGARCHAAATGRAWVRSFHQATVAPAAWSSGVEPTSKAAVNAEESMTNGAVNW